MNTLEFNPQHHDNVFADVLRIIFGFVPAAILMGLVVSVVVWYFKAWRVSRFRAGRAGLLPHHVWMIGVSYLIILSDSVYALVERLHHPLNPHTFLVLPGYVLGCASLYTVLRYERLRYSTDAVIAHDVDDDVEEDL